MYSTLTYTTCQVPAPMADGICGHYLFYPDETGRRQAEGGLRTKGVFKDQYRDIPLVSVITPVWNRDTSLERAIYSVLGQTYPNIEYILIDGGSSDSTVDVILKYNDVVDYFISEPDSSLYEAINKGISLARGDYIIILNSDDWYAHNAVACLVETIRTRDVDLVSALAWEVDDSGSAQRLIPTWDFDEFVMLRMPIRHELMLVPRRLYNIVGYYDASYKIIADLKLTQKIYHTTQLFHEISDGLLYFSPSGLSSAIEPLTLERERLLKENFNFLCDSDIPTIAALRIVDVIPFFSKYKGNSLFIAALRAYLKNCSPYECY